jgi:hypothetical protein
MLSGLDFETAERAAAAAPNRADIACFVGFVGRRTGVAVPAPVLDQLRAAGWIDGPWALDAERIDALLQVPVVLDGWNAFDRLFAWNARTVRSGEAGRCASYLGAAVRSFFAHGGRRLVVVRVGDPWPYLDGEARAAARIARLGALVPSLAEAPRPFEATDPGTWSGIEHLYGLGEVSHVCLPDLADLFSADPPEVPVERTPTPPPEVFVTCSADEPATPVDRGLRFVSAPRLDAEGYGAWAGAVAATRTFLARYRRDALLVATIPLPQAEAQDPSPGGLHAGTDWLAFLHGTGVLENAGSTEAAAAASAFVQLAWPWLRTPDTEDLPERLEPAGGVLTGVLAANALVRGTFRSVAGTPLPRVIAPEPMPDLGLGPDSPTTRLAERVCVIGPEPDGVTLLSDVTSTPDAAWRAGGVSRLMSTVLRAARRVGEEQLFEANGPELWSRIRRAMEDLLNAFVRAGALEARGREPAYEVRCDRTTMTQNDLDNGRVRVDITVAPAAAVERITVSLELSTGAAESGLREVA